MTCGVPVDSLAPVGAMASKVDNEDMKYIGICQEICYKYNYCTVI